MEELAQVLILLALFGIAMAYARGGLNGEDGVTDWFKVKLLGAA